MRLNFALPKWGGSEEALRLAFARAQAAGVDEETLLDLYDEFIVRITETPTPGTERAYWEQVIAERPTWSRLESLANYHWRLSHWREMASVAGRLIQRDPDHPRGYYMRAYARESLGEHAAALADYRMAAALAHELAVDRLIRAHLQGFLGLPPNDWKNIYAICRYGAALGVPAAANCLGSIFFEANMIGKPFHTDLAQSLAWHLVAARGGGITTRSTIWAGCCTPAVPPGWRPNRPGPWAFSGCGVPRNRGTPTPSASCGRPGIP